METIDILRPSPYKGGGKRWQKVAKTAKGRNNQISFIDEKGRVTIPASIRRDLRFEEPLLMGHGLDRCIHLYTQEQWERVMQMLNRFNDFHRGHRKLMRRLMGGLERVEMDKQGRILIPGHLAERAGIRDRVLFIRMRSWFELWDPDVYSQEEEAFEKLNQESALNLEFGEEDL